MGTMLAWEQRLGWTGVFAVLLIVYTLTLAPSLTWAHYGADGGDLVTAVVRGRIPHPPGSPTYLLLGALFNRLPWRDPAWRLNLMSAVLAAAAAGLTAVTVQSVIHSLHPSPSTRYSPSSITCSSICAGLSLGLTPLFWSQAIIAEVYAPAAFFAALVAFLVLGGRPAWMLGLVWGVGMGVHPTLLFLAPMVAWGCWRKDGDRFRALVQAGLLAVLGWGSMYGPVLLARSAVPSPWGDVRTLDGWWAMVSGRLYHGYLFGLPRDAWPQRLLAWLGLLARQFTPPGAILAGLGWLHLWRERRPLAGVSALVVGAFSLYAVGYDAADSLVYLVLALPLAAVWLGAGLAQAAAWIESRLPRGAWLALMLPLLQAALFWGQMDLSGDHTAMEWAERVLEDAPSQAVVLTDRDAHTFTLWYAQDVLGKRPDVAVLDRDLWVLSPYREMMAAKLGLAGAVGELLSEDAARRSGRPIVRVTNNQ